MGHVHISGELYRTVQADMERYVHKNGGEWQSGDLCCTNVITIVMVELIQYDLGSIVDITSKMN